MSNQIVLENQLPGTPQSVWGLTNGPSSNIEGFATDISVDHGDTVNFKINTDSTDYRIEIYRLGYYGGDGARLVGTIDHQSVSAVNQPAPLVDPSTGLVDAGNWKVTDSWNTPADAVSGIYIAKLVREDGTFGENQIPFIVRNDGGQSDVLFQTSDSTWQAYNPWGGSSLYNLQDYPGVIGAPLQDQTYVATQAQAVSYNRPFANQSINLGENYLFGSEYPAIFWLEKNGFDVSYSTNVDTARSGSELLSHKVFLSVGHDEYWSLEQRANVETARDAGVNLAFWGGNDIYWKTEWGTSIDSTGDSFRTVITYKETQTDLANPSGVWTGTWSDPTQPGGANPQNALLGTLFTVNGALGTIQVPYEYTQMRFWNNTAVANTLPGEVATLVPYGLGTEWDSDLDNGFRPAGQIDLSFGSYYLDYPAVITDFSANVGEPGTATHSMTLYRADSGALVFSAGNQFFTWALDEHHDVGRWGDTYAPDPNIQQAMINMFGEMGVQPATLQSSLVPGFASTDLVAPGTMPSRLDVLVAGQDLTFSLAGTASDQGGGVVAGVETSFDGGASWRPVSGKSTWAYTYTATTPSDISIRAIDDSVNIGSSYSIPQSVIDVAVNDSTWGGGTAYALAYTDQVRNEEVIVWSNYAVAGQWTTQSIRFSNGELDVAYFDQVSGKDATVWNNYDPLGNWGQQILDYSDLTREIAQIDWSNQQTWSQVWDQYDALGNWGQQILYYDDGTTDMVQIDWPNEQPWSQVWDHYDALGNWDQQTLYYDDGTTDIVQIDWPNEQLWSQVWDRYDALGNLDQQTILYDDNTRLSATLDTDNLQPWYSDNYQFDASDTLISHYQIMDDGSKNQITPISLSVGS